MKLLKPTNEKLNPPEKIFGFDIETYDSDNKFLMGSFVNANNPKERYIFWNQKEMQDFVYNSRTPLNGSYIFATNLGFDFLGLFGDSYNNLSKFHYIIKGSEFVSITLNKNRSKKSKIVFLDTMNFVKFSVRNLGRFLGIEKLESPLTIGQYVKRFTKEGLYLEEYNIRDSLISGKFGLWLLENTNKINTNLKYTIASTSMAIFKNNYLKTEIEQPPKEIIEEMFKGYYGGRTEAFYRGYIENLNYYDFNSLYPYVMKKYKYPFPNTLKIDNNPTIDLIKKFEGLSKCEITTPENIDIPLLPLRFSGKLMFITGNFIGYYTHVELRKALEIGYKIKPLKTYYYEYTFKPFKDFVTDIYNKRMKAKEKKESIELFWKIILNSLYGKFSQKIEYSELFFCMNNEERRKIDKFVNHNIHNIVNGKNPRFKIYSPDNRTIRKGEYLYDDSRIYYITDTERTDFPMFINPILSLYITSYARLELYNKMEYIINNGGTVYYCDTDSIITDLELDTGKGLGELKKELYIKQGIIVKPKAYYLEGYDNKEFVKFKGMRNLKTFSEFNKLLKEKEFTYWKFTKFKESINRKLPFNQKLDVKKIIDVEDNKREWKYKFNAKKLEKSKPKKINLIGQVLY